MPSNETIIVDGSGGGAAPSVVEIINESLKIVEERVLSTFCPKNITFTERLTSWCKHPNNEVCDDGEYYLVDSDCKVTYASFFSGEVLKQMWFLRLFIIMSIFMFFKDSRKYPLIIAVLIGLFIYNNAFINPAVEYDEMQCTDVNFLMNAGYCIMPTSPAMGWLVGISIFILLGGYVVQERKRKKEKEKDKKKRKKKKLLKLEDSGGALK